MQVGPSSFRGVGAPRDSVQNDLRGRIGFPQQDAVCRASSSSPFRGPPGFAQRAHSGSYGANVSQQRSPSQDRGRTVGDIGWRRGDWLRAGLHPISYPDKKKESALEAGISANPAGGDDRKATPVGPTSRPQAPPASEDLHNASDHIAHERRGTGRQGSEGVD